MSKLDQVKDSSAYIESQEATEELESALGFIKPSLHAAGSTKASIALIKQNNTLLYLILRQNRFLADLAASIANINRQLVTLGKTEAAPLDLTKSIGELHKRIDTFQVTGSEPVKVKKGPIYAHTDPNIIFTTQYSKEKK